MTNDVVIERRGRVLVITLNRPASRNAMTGDMATAIGEALDAADASAAIGAVVVTGAGTVFCAGGDRTLIGAGRSIHSSEHPDWGFAGMRHHFIAKPVIAAVNGPALGGGFEICLAADLALASPDAEFGLTEVANRVPPNAGGALRLMHHLPRKRALELCLTGRPISAATALEWGLVNRIVERSRLLDESLALAALLAAFDGDTVVATKRVAYGASDAIEDEATRWHRGRDGQA